ncbi:hypothetical protein HPB50_019430 [Hyalomma asiaticum]|uniref:Uncharacterized protein n=1 Tax=Hyalomma asiaticum TaxID=266040 RepID=A0ACB7RS64_HYAAI|nr:hypothetical protein HPB50_019430 [Hyalomma asiaticum]
MSWSADYRGAQTDEQYFSVCVEVTQTVGLPWDWHGFGLALARSSCKTEQAIQDTKTCGSSFKSQLAQGSFNSSNPEDLHRACCSMDQLERCLHKASAEAGCKEEVSVLVHTLTQTAKDLLGDVYNTHCKFDCNGATRTLSASWTTALFVTGCSLLLLRGRMVATS